MTIKPTDVIAYKADADLWCPSCTVEVYDEAAKEPGYYDHEGELIAPVFADNETDYIPVCPGCLEQIPTRLTEHGRRELAHSYQGNRERAAAQLRRYADALKGEPTLYQDAMDIHYQNLEAAGNLATLLDELLSATLEGKAVIIDGVAVDGMDYELCRAAKWSNPGHNCWICQLEEREPPQPLADDDPTCNCELMHPIGQCRERLEE